MFLISVLPVSTGAAAVSPCANAGELISATSTHAAATDAPWERIELLYNPVNAPAGTNSYRGRTDHERKKSLMQGANANDAKR
jgi:hypothetical protein